MYQPDQITFSYRHAAPAPAFRYGAQVPRTRILAADIVAHINRLCGLPPSLIFGKSTSKTDGRFKHLGVFCIHKLRPDMSYEEIGIRMGGKDHSTIVHSMRVAIALRMKDREFYDLCETVIDHFRSRS